MPGIDPYLVRQKWVDLILEWVATLRANLEKSECRVTYRNCVNNTNKTHLFIVSCGSHKYLSVLISVWQRLAWERPLPGSQVLIWRGELRNRIGPQRLCPPPGGVAISGWRRGHKCHQSRGLDPGAWSTAEYQQQQSGCAGKKSRWPTFSFYFIFRRGACFIEVRSFVLQRICRLYVLIGWYLVP